MRFIDLFAGLGGFHYALRILGHECVFASEIDDELAALYRRNFPDARKRVYGDIRIHKDRVPRHDILCAGFPCQPFSKSGAQNGRRDKTRGTLFHEIVEVLQKHRPTYVVLENVGNFERHNHGRTWRIVRESLTNLGYYVQGTTHIASGGHGLVSPHHLGFPHTRERFFIVASLHKLANDPFPPRDRARTTSLSGIVQAKRELSSDDIEETSLTRQQIECIEHWNSLLRHIPRQIEVPSFPIWGDELGATYPFEDYTPYRSSIRELLLHMRDSHISSRSKRELLLEQLPSYARTPQSQFPSWKVRFIRQNRDWFAGIEPYLPRRWIERLRELPPSLRKLEWNCRGEERDLWDFVLQFRPSGLRAKRYTSIPALVAMTTTQVPILGPKRRFITRTEGLRLQGFPDDHELPASKAAAFAALGNAVHVEVAKAIAKRLLEGNQE